jgi:hypothetical protein
MLSVAAFWIAIYVGAELDLLPRPGPSASVDEIILSEQVHSSASHHSADIVLIGDSSCLMDCSAPQLEQELPGHRVLNLGTLSYLDLRAFGLLVARYAAANHENLRAVVLMVQPEMLRGPKVSRESNGAVAQWMSQIENGVWQNSEEDHGSWRGPGLIRRCFVDYFVPSPLSGAYGQFYGFNAGLREFMITNQGSAIDPRQYQSRAMREPVSYALASALEPQSRAFRALLPAGIRLFLALTPVPESEAPANHRARFTETLSEWNASIQADTVLSNLPPSLPDPMFASANHLNPRGVKRYTECLAHALKQRL